MTAPKRLMEGEEVTLFRATLTKDGRVGVSKARMLVRKETLWVVGQPNRTTGYRRIVARDRINQTFFLTREEAIARLGEKLRNELAGLRERAEKTRRALTLIDAMNLRN